VYISGQVYDVLCTIGLFPDTSEGCSGWLRCNLSALRSLVSVVLCPRIRLDLPTDGPFKRFRPAKDPVKLLVIFVPFS
jgi:hypothetical protein